MNMDTGQYEDALSCYSVVALASIDSTISIWKANMEKPFTVILDIFLMGVTDLSWGFNGNVLLASANDGQVFMVHFKPGMLGQPITELEKQIIIEKRYGSSVLNEYKKNTKIVGSTIQSSFNQASGPVVSQNLSFERLKEQQKTTQQQDGKKKIVPVMVKQYNDSASINPFINPFAN